MNKIIALVGMAGSGKSVACEYFEKLGFKKVYFGGVTIKTLNELNMDITPENEKQIREKLRKEYGMGAYAIKLLPEINEYVKTNNVVLDGLYSWEELKILKNEFNNLITIGIICDKYIRYDRISSRDIRPFNKKDVEKRDISEIENLEKGGPIVYADYYVLNNGTIDDLHNRIEEILKF